MPPAPTPPPAPPAPDPDSPAEAPDPPPPAPALPAADGGVAPPEATFEYQVAGGAASRAMVDISIAAHSPNARVGLWIAPPGLRGEPDAAAITNETGRWTVQPRDRYGAPRRVFLVLRPPPACRAGEALWARVTLAGEWLDTSERGVRTWGGAVADCSKPAMLIELLTVAEGSRRG